MRVQRDRQTTGTAVPRRPRGIHPVSYPTLKRLGLPSLSAPAGSFRASGPADADGQS
jgi:hypothetical protein